VRRIAASGRKVAVIGVENGYSIGTDIKRVKEFYDRGGRYMSLAHNGHSQLADSNTGEGTGIWLHGGLSPLGKQVIAEMNKWGIMVDVSHPSKAANLQAIALSKAPVIASHSAARAMANHSRHSSLILFERHHIRTETQFRAGFLGLRFEQRLQQTLGNEDAFGRTDIPHTFVEIGNEVSDFLPGQRLHSHDRAILHELLFRLLPDDLLDLFEGKGDKDLL